jgi:hypothetical protein
MGEGTLKELFWVHFPGSKLIDDSCDDGEGQQNLGICKCITNRGDWNLALSALKPFKSAGTGGIVPALLQQGAEHIIPHLCCIFRASMAYRFIPTAWRQVRVTFIPKPGKPDYTEAKAYRAISLSSFYLTYVSIYTT